MAESSLAPVNSSLVRRAFRRQLLIGALALLLLVFATAVLLLELRMNESVQGRYREALEIAQRALDSHHLAAQLAQEHLRQQSEPASAIDPDRDVQHRNQRLQDELTQIHDDLQRVRELPLTPYERGQLRRLESELSSVALPAPRMSPEPKPGMTGRFRVHFEAIAASLDALSASVAARALEASNRSQFLNMIARYTLFVAVLLAVSFGGLFALLMWRSQMASREVMGVLDRMAHEDGLTGITNRRGLDDGLVVELARARRTGVALTVVMLDLDHFKRFNDRRGHAAGDVLLRGAAQAWRHQLRPTDLLARYGGEEFTLVLPSCDAAAACLLIERLRPLVPERQTFSAGVATWESHESPEQLLNRADRALLVAKKQGRNRTVVSGQEPQMSLPLSA